MPFLVFWRLLNGAKETMGKTAGALEWIKAPNYTVNGVASLFFIARQLQGKKNSFI